MTTRRSWSGYGTLLAIWLIVMGWQAVEHARLKRSARAALVNRARDISDTIALLMRSQRFFGVPPSGTNVVFKDRLEPVLNDLVKQGELIAVELLNSKGESVAAAGPPIDPPRGDLPAQGYWDDRAATVTLENLVELGTNVVLHFPRQRPPTNAPGQNGLSNSPATPDGEGRGQGVRLGAMNGVSNSPAIQEPPPPPPDLGPEHDHDRDRDHDHPPQGSGMSNNGPPGDRGRPGRRGPRFSEEELKAGGVHGFIMVMSTHGVLATCWQDLWLRTFIGALAAVSVAGLGLAWRSLSRNADLQVRLVRVSELNSHLKEMNLAAAGLAHETRNPLNIIRGLAQMISKQPDASTEVRCKSREIIDEADRVAGQLNEFINYSRPREVRPAATNVSRVVSEVARALNYDVEEKKVRLQLLAEPLTIEADEQLLRQALFNLVLNAVQAVPVNGEITIRAGKRNGSDAYIEIADNGPGVDPEHREEIFKPYFTTQEKGTGLGLAVVQQIVLAHGWEIACEPNQPNGAIFRITHLKLPGRNG